MKNICWLILIFSHCQLWQLEKARRSFTKNTTAKTCLDGKALVFICSFDSSDKVLEQICRRAETDIELLAASSNVALKVADANNFGHVAFITAVDKLVTLEYELMATPSRGNYDAKAVYARLIFEDFYSNAVTAVPLTGIKKA